MSMSPQELLLPSWNLSLPHRQNFLDNHLAKIPITPEEQVTYEVREKDLSSAGAQYVDTRGYESSNLHHIEFFWEDPQFEVDAVLTRD